MENKSPRLLVAIESHLLRVLDLTNPVLRRKLGLTLKELAAEDWRKLLAAGKESLTQMVGRPWRILREADCWSPRPRCHAA